MLSQENSDFTNLIDRAKRHQLANLPFVIYRMPRDKKVTGLFQKNLSVTYTSDFEEEGFLFAPFDSSQERILLRPEEKLICDFIPSKDSGDKKTHKSSEEEKLEHISLVTRAVDAIVSGDLDKVIVSRKVEVRTQKTCFEIFEAALDRYKSSFCYLWVHPETGTWIGASPEVFVKTDDNLVKTVSLAGTMKIEGENEPIWRTKEIHEQQMVTEYIQGCFSQNFDKVTASSVESVKAGSVWHLKSVISGEKIGSFKLSSLIDTLHPTPAVCGLPKEKALKFIKENERYNRDYYTGFLGELNNNGTHLFVNLRCMMLNNGTASIFVGGGITKDSIPEAEWEETQHKSQTILSLL